MPQTARCFHPSSLCKGGEEEKRGGEAVEERKMGRSGGEERWRREKGRRRTAKKVTYRRV